MTEAERIAAIPWFARLRPDVRAALIAGGRWRSRAAGEWVHAEGDEDTGVLAVLSGGLHLYAQAPGGREVLFSVLPAGGVIGQSVLFGGGPRLVTAVCATDSRLFLLSDQSLRRTAQAHPGLWESLSRLAYAQLRAMVEATAELVALKPRERLIARLAALSGPTPRIVASQSALAELVGASRKAVNGWLGELERAGLVARGYGQIEVLDRSRLRRMIQEPG